MECNKEEAIKAVEVAERKFLERDFTGAKRFVLKAQNLYPQLDGLHQMLATFDVYIHSENKVCDEADWYGILGANPWDNEETIRKQYRKLVLMLHPDKNKSIGADGAFNLISEAWSLLSVPSRRHAYNQKRNPIVVPPPTQSFHAHESSPSPGNDVRLSESEKSKAKARTRPMKVAAATDPGPPHKDGTFWTICSTCRTHYEYQRRYLNHNLLCPGCSEVFVALEKEPPKHILYTLKASSVQGAAPDSSIVQGAAPDSSIVQGAAPDASIVQGAAPDSSIVQGAGENSQVCREKRDLIKRGSFAFEEEKPMKRKKVGNHHGPRGSGEGTNGKGRALLSSVGSARAFLGMKSLLLKKAHVGVRNKIEELKLDVMAGKKVLQVKGREAVSEQLTKDDKKLGGSGAGVAENVALSIDVPDSDFHNFDADRSEGSFGIDQVWAAYDDTDGMPRFYARIHKVISLDPFKIKLSWLDSVNDDEFGYTAWIESGFYKTCGDFKAGKQVSCNKLNGFSHEIVWSETAPGVGTIRILPRKGETWALFRNWSLEWNDATPDEVVYKYDIVEVLDDYKEESGILVSPLMKVAGFRSVFCPCEELGKAISIPKDEIQRFSHQIPSQLLTGEEAPNLRSGFWELDPASLPRELLEAVETDAEDDILVNEVAQATSAEQDSWGDEITQESGAEQDSWAG
ncbi:hypothetical protein MLD38_002909 [Melastoma candidum]|uniref:Uncharacterized protein n=1 Tax=Melastoma candidum TaxID=119954 RepID=A0ACB9S2U9_9MYRT|nr:hypothetical protein MLD38_002909 [Melastoma candidum]